MNNTKQIEILSRHFQLIVVDENIGRIETTEVVKEGRSFKNIKKHISYNLVSSNYEHTLFYNIIEKFKSNENFEQFESHNIRYLSLNLLQRIFSRNKKKRLMSKIQEMSEDMSWIIIPGFISSEVSKLQDFSSNEHGSKILFGTYNNISVFINPNLNSKQIYFGDYNSFKIIVNNNNLDFCLIDKMKLKVLQII